MKRQAKQSKHFDRCKKCEKSIQPSEPRYKITNQTVYCVTCWRIKDDQT